MIDTPGYTDTPGVSPVYRFVQSVGSVSGFPIFHHVERERGPLSTPPYMVHQCSIGAAPCIMHHWCSTMHHAPCTMHHAWRDHAPCMDSTMEGRARLPPSTPSCLHLHWCMACTSATGAWCIMACSAVSLPAGLPPCRTPSLQPAGCRTPSPSPCQRFTSARPSSRPRPGGGGSCQLGRGFSLSRGPGPLGEAFL